ncbi:succinoglycan transporter ExoP [Dulcicalothrix desertica PCC 7102]|uniref:Succinoglycan transporter ExoP n=1 Tax=Dulcicalothrix desertica PCC 7102 TaxID=232991 RepID=A0A3S1CCQ4_9CYAN|nr:polysaccharide biosynthesis tyrosine autokinase [Dulcicalothrix desertica]RUT00221.1 succinoglycan transporter ExoP [Dulcicalothrix desertica PCC 7102]TWH55689.1 capsular exopolysaccharide synthesis family protein [Dulcicalothrix desertica PCC 7102]
MLKSEKYSQMQMKTNAAQLNDADEGGLNLGQVGATLRRRALLIAGFTGVAAAGAVLKAESDPPIFQGQFEILTKPVTGESKAVANIPQTLGAQGVSSPETENVATTIKVLESPRLLAPIVKDLQAKYPDLTYKRLERYLNVTSVKPNILKVEYVDEDEQQVKDVLQALAKTYLDYSRAEQEEDVNEAIKFVQERITKGGLQQRVEDWQEKLRNLRRKNTLVEPAQKSQEVAALIASLNQQRIEARVQYEQMSTKYRDLQSELAQQPGQRAGNSLLSDNPRYQKILDQIQEADILIKKESARFTPENPTILTLQDKIDNLMPMLTAEEERVQRDYVSRINEIAARDEALRDKIKKAEAELKYLATVNRDYDYIQLQLKIATENYGQFVAKEQALQIEKAQKLQPWKPLDPQYTEVQKPAAIVDSAKRNLLLGGLLGLLLGTGAALVVDKLSNVFYTSKDVKDATYLPLLGSIPLRKELAVSLQDSGNQKPDIAAFFEVFRSLYTNILLLGSDTPIRSLVISSATPGDGKSTVAIYLALAAAAMGHRVLLVDANLRCPTLHKRVGVMNIQGLTDIIASDLDWSNVIERSPIENNLYVLSAGPIPPDPVRLLASQKMQDLMSDLQNSFDFVIYDTPPVLGFADANLLAANTNGMVLVAGLGKLKRTVFQQALEELQVSGTPVLGFIANKSKEAAPASYTYYQQYYKQRMSAERVEVEEMEESNSSIIHKIRGK